jgi:ribonuclease HII
LLRNYLRKGFVEAGCDEAGRGCLAGPVAAAAVIMPADYSNCELKDSKKMTSAARERLRKEIEQVAIAFSVAFIDNEIIDEINILKASILAMHRAIDSLTIRPGHLLIDGNRFYQYEDIPHSCIIKGDGKFVPIAAASVLAKTYRDELMLKLHQEYSHYGWCRNKGYPTIAHRKAITEFGITKYHRRSYHLTNNQLHLNFTD